jgi:hypothetical protein
VKIEKAASELLASAGSVQEDGGEEIEPEDQQQQSVPRMSSIVDNGR